MFPGGVGVHLQQTRPEPESSLQFIAVFPLGTWVLRKYLMCRAEAQRCNGGGQVQKVKSPKAVELYSGQ